MPKRKVRLNVPPTHIKDVSHYQWNKWFDGFRERVGEGPLQVQGYSSAFLPDPQDWGSLSTNDPFSSIIFVYNAAGGPTIAFSDGTDWISALTGAPV